MINNQVKIYQSLTGFITDRISPCLLNHNKDGGFKKFVKLTAGTVTFAVMAVAGLIETIVRYALVLLVKPLQFLIPKGRSGAFDKYIFYPLIRHAELSSEGAIRATLNITSYYLSGKAKRWVDIKVRSFLENGTIAKIKDRFTNFHINGLKTEGPKLQNLGIYMSTLLDGLQLQEDLHNRNEKVKFLSPVDAKIVYPITYFISDRIATPLMDGGYKALRSIASLTKSYIHTATGKVFEKMLSDPISSEFLDKWGGKIEHLSLKWAKRKPTSLPFLEYADTCSIVAARRLFVFTKDMRALLGVTKKLKGFADKICEAAKSEIINPLAEQIKNAKSGSEKEKSLLTLLWGVGKHIATEKGKELATQAVDNLKEKTYQLVEEKEKALRSKIVAHAVKSVAQSVIESSTRWAVRLGLLVPIYMLSKYLPTPAWSSQLTSVNRAIVLLAGLALWTGALTPSGRRIYESYDENFDTEASTLLELKSLFNRDVLKKMVGSVTEAFAALPSGQYLENFKNRVSVA